MSANRSYSYAEFATDIRKCCEWLKRFKLRPGSRAALQISDIYAYWVLFYALEARGVVSIALPPDPPVNASRIKALSLEFVFSDHAAPEGLDIGWNRVDRRWFAAFKAFRDLPLPVRRRRPDDPICIVLSSGTTGASKKVLFDRALLDLRMAHGLESRVYSEGSLRSLASIPPASVAGLSLGLCAFAMGGTLCVRSDGMSWEDTFLKLGVNSLILAPIHIQMMLAELPADFRPDVQITIFVVGGTLSKPMTEDLRRRVSRNIIQGYGTTETGGITQGHIDLMIGGEDAAGSAMSWLEVSLLNDAGEECSPNEIGEVRIRGADVIGGYLEDDEQNLKSFRDGWYHPGDLAVVDETGILRIVGRTDDLINVGGLKVIPGAAESLFLKSGAVSDVAVFGVPQLDAEPSIWVAYVAQEPLDRALVSRVLRGVTDVQLARVAAIPRNLMGKIERVRLREDAESSALARDDAGR